MYCPNCSKEASTDQKFCRVCGMDLQVVSALVGAQKGIAKSEKLNEGVLGGRQKAMIIWGMILTLVAVAVGASLKILGKEHIEVAGGFTPFLNVIVLLIAFFGIGLMSYPIIQMIGPARKSQRGSSLEPAPTAKQQPGLLSEEPASITEETTELLAESEDRTSVRDTAQQNKERDVLS